MDETLGITALSAAFLLPASGSAGQPASRPMVFDDAADTVCNEPPPHGAIRFSTGFRISDGVPGRMMEFRKRILHPGSAIGLHWIAHDAVDYAVSGTGAVTSGGATQPVRTGIAAYLFDGETVGIRQTGSEPLVLIIAYSIRR